MSRRTKSVRHQPKPKLLLDEALPPRSHFPLVNQYCNVKHIAHDLHLGGSTDQKVFAVACTKDCLLVTPNIRHFRSLVTHNKPSIIGVSSKLSDANLDRKLMQRIRNLKSTEFTGHYFSITN